MGPITTSPTRPTTPNSTRNHRKVHETYSDNPPRYRKMDDRAGEAPPPPPQVQDRTHQPHQRLYLSPSDSMRQQKTAFVESDREPTRTRSLKTPRNYKRAVDTATDYCDPFLAALDYQERRRGSDQGAVVRDRTGSMPGSGTPPTAPRNVPQRRGGSFRTPRSNKYQTRVRYDEWPQPEVNSTAQKFLQLSDSDDYSRLRSFGFDEKGCVISRGDSFRRKTRDRSETATSKTSSNANKSDTHSSRSGSPEVLEQQEISSAEPENDKLPHRSYEVMVLGLEGAGKTSLINQCMTSEHRNPFSMELDSAKENVVSIVIEGDESELKFKEINLEKDDWRPRQADSYIVLYACDRRESFRTASNLLEEIKEKSTSTPCVLAGNRIDLARKRVVTPTEAASLARNFSVEHFEISCALNMGVDELLIGLLSALNRDQFVAQKKKSLASRPSNSKMLAETGEKFIDGFRSSFRRLSRRRQNKEERSSTSKSSTKGDESKTAEATKGDGSKTATTAKGDGENKATPSGEQPRKHHTTGCSNLASRSGFTKMMNRILKRNTESKSCEDILLA